MYEWLGTIISKNKFLSKYLKKEMLPVIGRYLITGFSSAFLELVLFYVLLEKTDFILKLSNHLAPTSLFISFALSDVAKLKLYLSNTIAYTVIFIYNYLMQRKWTFKSTGSIKKQLVQYGVLFIFNLFISNFIVDFMNLGLGIHSIIAKIIAIGVVVSWNFIIYKKVIFKK